MDSCKELLAFFDNSPKRKKFLDKVIDSLSAETKKRKLKDLCKTQWVERHSTFETLFELYEYIVIALNEICHPSNDESIYPDNGMLELGFKNENQSKWLASYFYQL